MLALRRMILILGALGGTDEERKTADRARMAEEAKTRVQDVQQFNVSLWHPVRLVYHESFSAQLNILPPIDLRLSGGDVWLKCSKVDGTFPNRTLRSGDPDECQEMRKIWFDRGYNNIWQITPAQAASVADHLRLLIKEAKQHGEDVTELQADLAEAEHRSCRVGLKSPISLEDNLGVCLTYEYSSGRVSLKLPEARLFVVVPDSGSQLKNIEANLDFQGVCNVKYLDLSA